MLPNSSTPLFFMGAALLICVTPGPDMLYVIANGIQRGVRGGVVAALGMATGMLVHTVFVVGGLSVLVTSSPALFDSVRVVGASYLLWIAFQTLRARKEQLDLSSSGQRSMSDIFRRAVITNILNPKVAIFFLAFLPQFVPVDSLNPRGDLLLLGVVFLTIGLLVDALIGAASGRVREILSHNRDLTVGLNTVSGLAFATLGLIQIGAVALERVHGLR